MAKRLSFVVVVAASMAFVGLGVVQAKGAIMGSPPIILVSGKSGENHGKAGEHHGKAGEDHGKAGKNHGKAGDDHGKAGNNHGKKKGHDKKAH